MTELAYKKSLYTYIPRILFLAYTSSSNSSNYQKLPFPKEATKMSLTSPKTAPSSEDDLYACAKKILSEVPLIGTRHDLPLYTESTNIPISIFF
jgi:hypothetical protein